MAESAEPSSKLPPLVGSEDTTVDSKGRLVIAKKFRTRLGEGFAICAGEFGCLFAIPNETWQQMQEVIDRADPMSEARRTYTRFVFGIAADNLKMDDGGRVILTEDLREFAMIDKEVKMIGAYDRVEIWDVAEYKKFKASPETYNIAQREAIKKAYDEMKGK